MNIKSFWQKFRCENVVTYDEYVSLVHKFQLPCKTTYELWLFAKIATKRGWKQM